MLVIDNICLCKMSPDLLDSLEDEDISQSLEVICLLLPSLLLGRSKTIRNLNDRHLLPSEILWLVLQLLMASLLRSLNYLPEMFSPTADCPAPMYYFNCSSAGPGATGSECQKSCKTQDMHCVRSSAPSRGTAQHGCACRIFPIKHWWEHAVLGTHQLLHW